MDKEIALWVIGILVTFIVAPMMGYILTRISSHGDRIIGMEKDIEWIRESFKVMGKKSVRVLHSPHTPELDDLLEKYECEDISWEEVNKLSEELENIVNDPSNEERKAAAILLLGAVTARYRVRT